MKVVIKADEASIACKGLHDLDELDRSKLFFLRRPVCVCWAEGGGGCRWMGGAQFLF